MKEIISLFVSFFKIGIMTFGGGYAMLPMLERELVDKKKYVTMDEIMDYYAVGQCTPGVIAVNVATFIGYKRKGVMGGIFATLGVVFPSIIIITLLVSVLQMVAGHPIVEHAFSGISVAVCALIVQAIFKLSKSGIKDILTGVIAAIAFLLSFFLNLSPIIIILGAGVVGVIAKTLLDKKKEEGNK
ncbi:MAG: chromate transporter [Clostridia bacterium]|nr:chromate transporter [Clostridia bacterium]